MPTLGVCLGHQAIVEAFGGEVGAAHELVHGKASAVDHDGRGIFLGLPQGFQAGRYHSLAAARVPDVLEVSATFGDEVMAVRHRELPIDGVQFHPESVLTPLGRQLLRNFLDGAPRDVERLTGEADGRLVQRALARVLDGHDLDARRGADGDGRDHAGRRDAGPDRRLPDRAARQGRDRGRDRRLRGGDARARARR